MVLSIWDKDSDENAKMVSILLSAFSVVGLNISTVLFEDGIGGKSIGDYLFGRRYGEVLHEDTNYYHRYGNEFKTFSATGLGTYISVRNKPVLEIMENSLYYIPQPPGILPAVYDYDFEDYLFDYIDIAEERADLTVINTSYRSKATTKYILARAKKIIVVIKPEYLTLSHFFDEFSSIRNKCVFIVFRNQIDRKEIQRIRACFNLERDNFIVIKKSEKFEEAALNGKIIDYLKEYHDVGKKSSEFSTISSIRYLTKMLFSGEYEYLSGVTRKYCALVKE